MKKRANSPYQALATLILGTIVPNKKSFSVTEEVENEVKNIVLTVAKEDMGRVIGKNGKIIKAIRNMLRIRAIKDGGKINVSLLE